MSRGVFKMSVDVQGLRDTIRGLEREIGQLTERVGHLSDHVTHLKQTADDAERQTLNSATGAASTFGLPPSVVVRDPATVADYLAAHPDLTNLAQDMATALVNEFQDERSEIELVLYLASEIDDRYLAFFVRPPCI
jgi:hypothetical protein